MKKIYLLILISIWGLHSCSLDEPTYGQTSTENFYQTETEINYALTTAYLQLRHTYNEYFLNHYLIGDCTTDDALKGGSSDSDRAEVFELSSFTTQTSNAESNRRWELLFLLINRCNDVIYHAPNASGDAETLARYVKEAKALRAFGYYNLVISFGGVPKLTEPLAPLEILKTVRSSEEEIYALIEEDLKAASTLPGKNEYSANDAYRVTRGFAKTILAKCYMFRGNYTMAEQVLRDIVEVDRDYELFPDFAYNWRQGYENGSESIFELGQQMYTRDIKIGSQIPHFFTSRNNAGYQGYGFHVPTHDLYDAFESDDPRIVYTFTRTGDRYIGDAADQDNSESETGYHDYKHTVPFIEKDEGYRVYLHSYNLRVIRYADVLLLYAEALNENGNASKALTYLNMIRKRARNTSPVDPRKSYQVFIPTVTESTLPDITTTNKDELREKIWNERRCELAMEGWRREDLQRQKRFGEVMRAYAQKYNTLKGANFDDARDYLLPIPQGEIDKSNDVLSQNDGY